MVSSNVRTVRRNILPMLLLALLQPFNRDESIWNNGLLSPLFADCILYGCFNMLEQLEQKLNLFASKSKTVALLPYLHSIAPSPTINVKVQ